MESMINEKISPRDQKIIDEMVSYSSAHEVIPTSFIQEMVMFSSKRRGSGGTINVSSSCDPPPPQPQPPRPPPPPPSEARSLVVSEVISKGVSTPKIQLPLPKNYQLSTTTTNLHDPPKDDTPSKKEDSTVWSMNSEGDANDRDTNHDDDEDNNVILNNHSNLFHQSEQDQNRNLFTKKDLKILESVFDVSHKHEDEDDILRIICRTGRFKENGFPCHKCLEILIPFKKEGEAVTFSHESGGRCGECLKFKTREEWDSISWQRLEWYTRTPDGKIAASVFKSLVDANKKSEKVGFIEKIASETVERIVSKLGDLITTNLKSKRISQIISEKISKGLQDLEIDF